MFRALKATVLGLALLGPVACSSNSRVHKLVDFDYLPKSANAEIELFQGPPVKRPYEPIAIIDSKRYTLVDYNPDATEGVAKARHDAARAQNEEALEQMLRDLEELASQIGGDAVHKIRLLSTRSHTLIPDEAVPLPGAMKQGMQRQFFRRGEVIRYLDKDESSAKPSNQDEKKP